MRATEWGPVRPVVPGPVDRGDRTDFARVPRSTESMVDRAGLCADRDRAAGRRVDRRIPRAALRGPSALDLASSWLERELRDASDEDIRAFAKIAGLGQSEIRSAEVTRLGINHVYLVRLTERGVLKRLSRGRYELRMAPAVAYFHALRRSIKLS